MTSSSHAITDCKTSTRWSTHWSRQLPLSEGTIRSYLTTNIHYVLDEECVEGMRGFFRMAAETGVLPEYELPADCAGCIEVPVSKPAELSAAKNKLKAYSCVFRSPTAAAQLPP